MHRLFTLVLGCMCAWSSVTVSEGALPGVTRIAEIRLIGGAVHVGDRVRLASAGLNDTKALLSWRLLQRPSTSRAKLAEHPKHEASFVADVPGRYVVEL